MLLAVPLPLNEVFFFFQLVYFLTTFFTFSEKLPVGMRFAGTVASVNMELDNSTCQLFFDF